MFIFQSTHNPKLTRAGLVSRTEDHMYSSVADYAGEKAKLEDVIDIS